MGKPRRPKNWVSPHDLDLNWEIVDRALSSIGLNRKDIFCVRSYLLENSRTDIWDSNFPIKALTLYRHKDDQTPDNIIVKFPKLVKRFFKETGRNVACRWDYEHTLFYNEGANGEILYIEYNPTEEDQS